LCGRLTQREWDAQCGTPKPDARLFQATTKFFEVPVRRVATSLTIVVGFLDKLNLLDKLAVADMQYVTSPCLKKREQECKSTLHVNPAGATWDGPPNPAWLALTAEANCTHGVDLVLTDMFGSGASLRHNGMSSSGPKGRHLRERFNSYHFI
jgi:hypothetical protein